MKCFLRQCCFSSVYSMKNSEDWFSIEKNRRALGGKFLPPPPILEWMQYFYTKVVLKMCGMKMFVWHCTLSIAPSHTNTSITQLIVSGKDHVAMFSISKRVENWPVFFLFSFHPSCVSAVPGEVIAMSAKVVCSVIKCSLFKGNKTMFWQSSGSLVKWRGEGVVEEMMFCNMWLGIIAQALEVSHHVWCLTASLYLVLTVWYNSCNIF